MQTVHERIVNVPNALSFYRLCAAPVAIWAALGDARILFAVLIVISLATDAIDGFLARILKQQTHFGARLDALADGATLVATVIGGVLFHPEALLDHALWLGLFLGTLSLALMVSLIKFRKLPAFHLYSFKVTDVLLSAFFVVLFTYGFVEWLFLVAIVVATLASLEIVLVALALDQYHTDQKGLYWVLRNRAAAAR